jgi:hypothetical protein
MMMIHPKKFEMLVKQQVAKQHKISSLGSGSWHPAAKEHMMAYDKQTIKRHYTDVRQGNNPLGGYEEVLPHVNSYVFNLHFLASNKQRVA